MNCRLLGRAMSRNNYAACPSWESINKSGCGPLVMMRQPDTCITHGKVEMDSTAIAAPNLIGKAALVGSQAEPTLITSEYEKAGLLSKVLAKDLTSGLGSLNYCSTSLTFLHDSHGVLTVSYELGARGNIDQTVSYDPFISDVRPVYSGKCSLVYLNQYHF